MGKYRALVLVGALCGHAFDAAAQPETVPPSSTTATPQVPPGPPPPGPIVPPSSSTATPPVVPGPPPPGPVARPPAGATHAMFVSTSPQIQWDVTLDDRLGCTTPCTLWVQPHEYVAMHSRGIAEERLDLGILGGGDLRVDAKPLARGAYATGVTFTALAGTGLTTGITLLAVGCATSNSGLCEAGAITAIPSAILLYASIELIRHALPHARVHSARPYLTGNQVGLAGHF